MLARISAVIFFLSLTSLAIAQDTYLDTFSSSSYSNNDGSANFSSDWTESSDDSSAGSGRIRVTSGQLRFSNIDDAYIYRFIPLNGATAVTLTFDYDASSSGNEVLDAYIYNSTTGNWNLIFQTTISATGSASYNLTAAEIASNPAIIFSGADSNWSNGETVYIDNVRFISSATPSITIDDVTVNEDAGTATFTATHSGASTSGSFSVNYTTVNGTSVAGSDYVLGSGVLNFNGTVGDTEQITVTILDDSEFEVAETFTTQFTAVTDASVDIGSTGTGTIIDNDVLNNTELTLFEEFDGYVGYTSTGGSLRTTQNGSGDEACQITTSSSNSLTTPIPSTATIDKAYLYWAHSNPSPDAQVTFEGNTVTADFMYTTSLSGRAFFGGITDVTSIIESIADPSTNVYDFSGLTVDTSSTYCGIATVLGGWSLFVFYKDPNLPAATINLYQGFDGASGGTTGTDSASFSLSGFYAIGSTGSKTTVLSWEGDQTLANNESLTFQTPSSGTNELSGDGDNDGTTDNPFNSTIYDDTVSPVVNTTTSYGVDLDTYDVSSYISQGETSAMTTVNVGQDFVILNAVVLKVPSNLITGTVFEDINYGGGSGRDLSGASGVGLSGVTVELYNSSGTLLQSTSTESDGKYVFAGMADGSYRVRVVNGSVTSSRGGGTSCSSCLPVQTFRKNYNSGFTEVTDEIGGADPSRSDVATGVLTNAQTVSNVTISAEGVAGLDFGFNFNTIVNTNESGQGSLAQFILNSNALDETGLDIEANSIFDPDAGADTSIFMIPSVSDPLGRTMDTGYTSGYFNISISNGKQLPAITGSSTSIDGRTQTAYSGNTNSGSLGTAGTTVGVSNILLPTYNLPEVQVHGNGGNVFRSEGADVAIRNLAIYASSDAGIEIKTGSVLVTANVLGVNAQGVHVGSMEEGVEIVGGSSSIDGNFISKNATAGIVINGGTSIFVQNNHITGNGSDPCEDNISIGNGSSILIQQNLIELGSASGIDGTSVSGQVTITENTITTSGQNNGTCSGKVENAGVRLDGNNAAITLNRIQSNAGPGIVLRGGNTSGNLISQNSIYANGSATHLALGIDIDASGHSGDGVSINDTGDTDNGPNGMINFPIISAAYLSGNNLILKGWSRAGATIEVFLTDFNSGSATKGDNQVGGVKRDYGEGQVYLGSGVEGSVADTDTGISSYTDVDGNSDNTNLFEITIPLVSTVAIGDFVTATATISNSTSEFSPFGWVKVKSMITNRRITYRVKN